MPAEIEAILQLSQPKNPASHRRYLATLTPAELRDRLERLQCERPEIWPGRRGGLEVRATAAAARFTP